MTDTNRPVQAVLDQLVADGPEVGVQVAVYVRGELVVDAWAGVADEASGRAVDGDTLFSASSTGKGVAATCMHVLADRGRLDYEAPVCTYWPEFAANGKANVTVRHILSHRSGIPHPPPGFDPEMMVDWDRMAAGLAALRPLFEPGTKTAYQASTFGFLTGEILRRIDGRPIGEFLQQEVCRPLGIDALFFGVPDEALPRVATLKEGPGYQRPSSAPPPSVTAETFNRTDARKAALPSSGAITNARSLARHYAMLAQGGELDGVRLLRPERIRIATELQTDAVDEYYRVSIRRGLGYRLGGDAGPGAGPNGFGHVGNGMFGYADPDRQVAIGFLKNYLGPSPAARPAPGEAVYAAVEAALGLAPAG